MFAPDQVSHLNLDLSGMPSIGERIVPVLQIQSAVSSAARYPGPRLRRIGVSGICARLLEDEISCEQFLVASDLRAAWFFSEVSSVFTRSGVGLTAMRFHRGVDRS